MEYLHRDSRDVPFGWFELIRAALAPAEATPRREPLRLPAPPAGLPTAQAR
ncbi:MAG: hypothetical protein K1X35_00105 [Caulobacteraceae bacterium]|nr:hypothetical protein [Caulobacteraceae bacterium]